MPNSLSKLVDATLVIEKLRVASQVRQSHLALQNRIDPETDELLNRIQGLEEYVDDRIADLIRTHPAYSWFSRVKGIGRENIGKVVGSIRIKPDPEFPDKPYADTISALWAYCGYAVVDGHAPKRIKGEGKLSYNSQLRSMCHRLGDSLLRAGLRMKCVKCNTIFGSATGKCPNCGGIDFEHTATSKFAQYYLKEKAKYKERFNAEGRTIVPAPFLTKVDGKHVETAEFISEGHVHNMALRKVIKAFLACLYIAWCRAESLPVRQPYAIEYLGHNHQYEPKDFTDR